MKNTPNPHLINKANESVSRFLSLLLTLKGGCFTHFLGNKQFYDSIC